MGDVDELNSQLGVLLAEPLPDDVRQLLSVIQHELFNLGGELSIPGFALLKSAAVVRLDLALAHYNAGLPRLKEFILPAGTRGAALAHVGRTWRGAPSDRSSRSRPPRRCATSRGNSSTA
jgi:cob(I)alamin adenosyltransferase